MWGVHQRGPHGGPETGSDWGQKMVAWMKIIAIRTRIHPRRDG